MVPRRQRWTARTRTLTSTRAVDVVVVVVVAVYFLRPLSQPRLGFLLTNHCRSIPSKSSQTNTTIELSISWLWLLFLTTQPDQTQVQAIESIRHSCCCLHFRLTATAKMISVTPIDMSCQFARPTSLFHLLTCWQQRIHTPIHPPTTILSSIDCIFFFIFFFFFS